MTPSVAFIQDGARLHYAVPIALYQQGILGSVFADTVIRAGTWSHAVSRLLEQTGWEQAKRLSQRRLQEVPSELVRTNVPLRLFLEGRRRLGLEGAEYYQWEARQVGTWVRRVGLSDASILQGFIRNVDPTLFSWAKAQGRTTVGDQILAPTATIEREARIQRKLFPDWDSDFQDEHLHIFRRWEEESWRHLDHVLCPSPYVAEEMAKVGVTNTSIHPYPIRCPPVSVPSRITGRQLTVGFLGTVGIRKGAPYFFEVAQRLSKRMKFVMVGGLRANSAIAAQLSQHVTLTGRVSRLEAQEWLRRFDVLLFPTTCEGCAGVTQEALAYGVPVLTSPNAGSTVRDGVEGYILPYEDTQGFVRKLEELDDDRALLERMSGLAQMRAAEYDLAPYGQRLGETLSVLV